MPPCCGQPPACASLAYSGQGRSSFHPILALTHPPNWPLGMFTLIMWLLHITCRSGSRHPRHTYSSRERPCFLVRLGGMYALWCLFSATWFSRDTTQVHSSNFPMELAMFGTNLSLRCGQLWIAPDTALLYAGHSFRISAATTTAQWIPDSRLRPWNSGKVQRYRCTFVLPKRPCVQWPGH